MQNDLEFTQLTAISPIDGRYANQTQKLRYYFSEFAVIKERITVELFYLQTLSQKGIIRTLSADEQKNLNELMKSFSVEDAKKVKEIEKTTRHDVKAIEYFLKQKLEQTSLKDVLEMIHFGVTSEDISNIAFSRLLQAATKACLIPDFQELISTLIKRAEEWKSIAMLARTHGKDAPATTIGKEIALFAFRLAKKYDRLNRIQLTGKLTGVIGNFHELSFATSVDVTEFSQSFIKQLGLQPQLFTTQIEPHDSWAELFHLLSEIGTIIKSFDQNIWMYISHDYFTLLPKKGQIGSSVMPHKGRNPIGFENSEGNAILAVSLFATLASELPNSRFQRHLSDTTLTRNIGLGYGYLLLALQNANTDIADLQVVAKEIESDLENKWGIVTATIQTKLRSLGIKGAYETFDQLAKSGNLDKDTIHEFIKSLNIEENDKNKLLSLNPSYSGKAEELTEMMIEEIKKIL